MFIYNSEDSVSFQLHVHFKVKKLKDSFKIKILW